MYKYIQKKISPPIFPGDEEKTRSAGLLNAILLIVILMVTLFSILAYSWTPTVARLLVELTLVLVTVFTFFLNRSGRVRLASILFSITLLIIVSVGTFLSGGVRGSTLGAYIGIIIITGILLGNRVALFNGVIMIAFAGWLVFADAHHMVPMVGEQMVLITQWGEFSTVLIGIIGLLSLVTTNLERTVERVRRKESELSYKLVESQQLTIWAQEASEFKSHLLARVSHELRTPLGVMTGMAEMLQQEIHGSLTGEQKKLVERIQVNAKYLETTFTELLEQSQFDKEMLQMQATVFSPASVLDRMLPDFLEQIETKGLSFKKFIAPDLPNALVGVPTHIEQILYYLLGNAIKFTDKGSVGVKLLRVSEQHWSISVIDTGIGIPKEKQELIFEPFRQVDESTSREFGGIGLGLSIVKRLTAAMKGDVQVESEPGQGSTFIITLPLVKAPPDIA